MCKGLATIFFVIFCILLNLLGHGYEMPSWEFFLTLDKITAETQPNNRADSEQKQDKVTTGIFQNQTAVPQRQYWNHSQYIMQCFCIVSVLYTQNQHFYTHNNHLHTWRPLHGRGTSCEIQSIAAGGREEALQSPTHPPTSLWCCHH